MFPVVKSTVCVRCEGGANKFETSGVIKGGKTTQLGGGA